MRIALATIVVGAAAASAAACVPADESLELGSAAFGVVASRAAGAGVVTGDEHPDGTYGWVLRFDRVLLGFRTVTIGKVDDDERCAFRGRGETNDVVFDPRAGLEQTFDGIRPTTCPDVGLILGPPGDATGLGPGATSAGIVDLAQGRPAHAIVDVTADHGQERLTLHLRFETDRTASRFGGCSSSAGKGIVVRANERTRSVLEFRPENLFFDAIASSATFRLSPFVLADRLGEPDGVVTMDEVDALPLVDVRELGPFYSLPDGTLGGSFGDYLRALFRFTFAYDVSGFCVGNAPGREAAR